jgi:hypothetical protein
MKEEGILFILFLLLLPLYFLLIKETKKGELIRI